MNMAPSYNSFPTVPPPSLTAFSARLRGTSSFFSSGANSTCDYGRVYMYDLPVIFNKELVDDCESLNPSHSRCEAQYGWHLPEDPAAYSVFIDRGLVKNGASIKAVLERQGTEKIRKMREKIVEFIPQFVYGVKDALDVAVDGVLRRFQQRKRELKEEDETGHEK